MAPSILQGLKKFAKLNELKVDEEMFRPIKALVEFKCEVIGLPGRLPQMIGNPPNVDANYLEDIAIIVGTTPQVICRLPPANAF
ncbi:hypothetical protein SAMN05216330_1347 [Bradyrhizobium sp. Ghvi]|uniref:hypothetical protein n=1 Tax=Bradyrhizobium sp. Ghvi TaxID=1855319 RepID=UPI0008E44483|nr:hypothetical protein [Bradyrhizobium sp. Ghvi]SFQ36647.1 hypothetical protein SAMN05216330_1347 [Bradyrhizobium sp. Ghvi]